VRCVRAYSAALESPLFPHPERVAPNPTTESEFVVNLFAAWKACEDAYKEKRRGLPEHSVYAHVLKNLNSPNKRPLMGYYSGDISKRKPVDMHAELRTSLKRLADPKTSDTEDPKIWSPYQLRKLRGCLHLCRGEVLREAQIVACTSVISGTTEMAEFASSDADQIVLMVDQAFTMPFPLSLIPFDTKWAHKIKGIYMFGDLEQGGVKVTAGSDKDNTLNEFLGAQKLSWFECLLNNGFPSYPLGSEEINRSHY